MEDALRFSFFASLFVPPLLTLWKDGAHSFALKPEIGIPDSD